MWGVLKRTCLFGSEGLGGSSHLGLAAGGLGLGLLGQKHSLDVGQHTSLGDGHAGQKLVQLLVVADGQLKVTGDDPGLLTVTAKSRISAARYSMTAAMLTGAPAPTRAA